MTSYIPNTCTNEVKIILVNYLQTQNTVGHCGYKIINISIL